MLVIENYDSDIEDLFLSFLLSDVDLFFRCLTVLEPDHFREPNNKKTISFVKDYVSSNNRLPMMEQIEALCKKKVMILSSREIEDHKTWFMGEFEKFARYRSLEKAILESADLLQEFKYGDVENKIKTAIQIGLVKDIGTDYFSNPRTRLEKILNSNGMISTGWKAVDKKLYGGLNRGEITLFAGQSGTGKSLFLQNLALNWAEAGLNVVYITLELSEELTSMRLDAMASGLGTVDVMRNIDTVHTVITGIGQKSRGSLFIKKMPANATNANDIRAYIRELEIRTNKKVDACLVDYLDLCSPLSGKINVGDLFVKDKYVSEELRNLAVDLNMLMVSASQLNRNSYEGTDFDPSHVAGGISKINTCDNAFAISTNAAMKEQGRYELQFIKTRSSNGVGSRCSLAFDPKSLRISDFAISGDEDDEDDSGDSGSYPLKTPSNDAILASIKSRSSSNGKKHSVQDNKKSVAGKAEDIFLDTFDDE